MTLLQLSRLWRTVIVPWSEWSVHINGIATAQGGALYCLWQISSGI